MASQKSKLGLETNYKPKPECAMRVMVRHYVAYICHRDHPGAKSEEIEQKIEQDVKALFS